MLDICMPTALLGATVEAEPVSVAATGADVDYVWFDFHHECRGLRYDRLSKLVDMVSRQLSAIGYFERDGGGAVVRRHGGDELGGRFLLEGDEAEGEPGPADGGGDELPRTALESCGARAIVGCHGRGPLYRGLEWE